MSIITQRIAIPVSVRALYRQWTRFEEYPRFISGVKAVRRLEGGRLNWVSEVDGLLTSWDAETTERIPDARLAWRAMDEHGLSGQVDFRPIARDRTLLAVRLDTAPMNLTAKALGARTPRRHRFLVDDRRLLHLVERRTRGRDVRGHELGDGHVDPRSGEVTRLAS